MAFNYKGEEMKIDKYVSIFMIFILAVTVFLFAAMCEVLGFIANHVLGKIR